MKSNLYDIFKQNFPQNSNSELLIVPGDRSWTYNEIDAHSARLANLFRKLGMKPGDRLVSMIEKSVFALCIYLSCLRSGIIYVPLNTAYTDAETKYFINDSNPKTFVCDPSNKDKILNKFPGIQADNILTVDQNGRGTAFEKSLDYDINFNIEKFPRNPLAVVLYSSGTTGISKGIAITHRALEINSKDLGKIWKISQKDTILHTLPIFHTHGLFVAINTALMHRCKIIFHSRFREEEAIDSLKDSTVFMGIPTYYQRMLSTEKLSSKSCSKIRLFISGSAPLMQETSDNFKNQTGHNIIERYGMSESGIITSNSLNTISHEEGNVGFPLPNQKIRISDNNDKILEQGQIGEIQIKGPNLFSFYWNKSELKKNNLTHDNFFRTGDLGKINYDGSLQLAGRNSDMFISGGFNVYPREVEKLLNKNSDIFESVVIGMPHSDYGEAGMAVIIPHENKKINFEKIKSYLKTELANYKIPKMFFTIKKLPRNTMGKVKKNYLKTKFSSEWKQFEK